MEPGIAALRADRGSVVDPIVRLDFREVIVEAPAPLHGGGVEDPDAAACLVDGHPPVVALVRPIGSGIAAEVLGWHEPGGPTGSLWQPGPADRRLGIFCTIRRSPSRRSQIPAGSHRRLALARQQNRSRVRLRVGDGGRSHPAMHLPIQIRLWMSAYISRLCLSRRT